MSETSSGSDYCTASGAYYIHFNWTYVDASGYNETRYRIQIDDNSDFSSLAVNYDTGAGALNNPSGTVNSGSIAVDNRFGDLYFGNTYYWRVKVYDNQGDVSRWYYGGTTITAPGTSFSTDAHAWPHPSFTFSPPTPLVNNPVSFTDASTCYDASNNPQSCSTTGARTYTWTFGDSNTSSVKGNVSHSYTAAGTYATDLKICEGSNCCNASDSTPVSSVIVKTATTVPTWKEISPF
jgi:PKD domain